MLKQVASRDHIEDEDKVTYWNEVGLSLKGLIN